MAVVQARIARVAQEVGDPWIRIYLDEPKWRLDTKDEDRAAQAVAAKKSGALVGVDYTEREGRNINPHTGKPYVDRYFNGIVDSPNGDTAAAGDGGIERVQPTSRQTDPKDAWRISLSAGAKLAVNTLPLMPTEQRDFETQKRIALAWGHWLYTTPPPASTPPDEIEFGNASSGRGAYTEPGEDRNPLDDPPPYLDDEWPPRD